MTTPDESKGNPPPAGEGLPHMPGYDPKKPYAGTIIHDKDKGIVFSHENHPSMKEANQKKGAAVSAFQQAEAKHAELQAELAELAKLPDGKTRTPAQMKVASQFALGNVKNGNPELDKELATKIQGLYQKHLSKELEDVTKANADIKKLVGEIEKTQVEAVKEWLKVEGRTPVAGKRFLATMDHSFTGKHFGIAKHEGFVTALKENFGWQGFKRHKVKSAFKAGTTVVGLGMVFDSLAHSQRKGADGEPPEQRSWTGRLAEGVIGAALAGGSALHGGR
jgi:hypothetical protein